MVVVLLFVLKNVKDKEREPSKKEIRKQKEKEEKEGKITEHVQGIKTLQK